MKTPMVGTLEGHPNLTDNDRAFLDRVVESLVLLADLTRGDILLYVGLADGEGAEIVAEAKPQTVPSIYQQSMCGQIVTRREEPAVLRVLAGMRPARRLNRVLVHGAPTLQDVSRRPTQPPDFLLQRTSAKTFQVIKQLAIVYELHASSSRLDIGQIR